MGYDRLPKHKKVLALYLRPKTLYVAAYDEVF